jgi:Icc-related predicted phosphoesterase
VRILGNIQDVRSVRAAAAGDIHCNEETCAHIAEAFARHDGEADVFLLAGDLTTHGSAEQATVLVDAISGLDTPVVAVLGNHDYHGGEAEQIRDVLLAGGIHVLDRSHVELEFEGVRVGVVGTKGFVGGFPGAGALPDFGEPLLREVYAETSREVEAIDTGLRAVADCDVRVLLLHYSPTMDTLVGEPEDIWTFLGSHRLGAPVADHHPDLVLHGHAHAGSFAGHIGAVPVFNVAVHVMNRDFWVFELEPHARVPLDVAEVHVEEELGVAEPEAAT